MLLKPPATNDSWDSLKNVSWLAREKKLRCTRITYTRFSSYYFFIKYFFARKSLWFRNFTASSMKRFEARDTKNLSCELITTIWINLYTRFISRIFSYCEHVLLTSHESSIAGFSSRSGNCAKPKKEFFSWGSGWNHFANAKATPSVMLRMPHSVAM